jgi:hypothetical protein
MSKQSVARVSAWSLVTRTRMLWRRVGESLADRFPREADCSDPRLNPWLVVNDSDVERRAVFRHLPTLRLPVSSPSSAQLKGAHETRFWF